MIVFEMELTKTGAEKLIRTNPDEAKFLDGNVYRKEFDEARAIAMVQGNPDLLAWIKGQTDAICTAAVKEKPSAIRHVNWEDFKGQKDMDFCYAALNGNGCCIKYIPDSQRTGDIIWEAVCCDGLALEFIDEEDQSEELCLTANKQNSDCFQFVLNQTEDVCKLAIDFDDRNFELIKEPTPELASYLIETWGEERAVEILLECMPDYLESDEEEEDEESSDDDDSPDSEDMY